MEESEVNEDKTLNTKKLVFLKKKCRVMYAFLHQIPARKRVKNIHKDASSFNNTIVVRGRICFIVRRDIM
ncbi:hypothetical protein Glove_340g20 [Diversispora epigaea]|uniref:Uncharacterized protein n=1 Tax=Diversispora epigaea TaxID=1348612 RepID=A0A397HGW7_9GLOM|nr:hypothetical protein Glove_340g20 [Diversispora epigaea]